MKEEDKKEFISEIRGLALTEDDKYEKKALGLVNELLNKINDKKSNLKPNQLIVDKDYLNKIETFFNNYS